jgi:hypothetical protein
MPTLAAIDQTESFATKSAFAGDAEILIAEGFFTPERPR